MNESISFKLFSGGKNLEQGELPFRGIDSKQMKKRKKETPGANIIKLFTAFTSYVP
jgi:hypothetical protein